MAVTSINDVKIGSKVYWEISDNKLCVEKLSILVSDLNLIRAGLLEYVEATSIDRREQILKELQRTKDDVDATFSAIIKLNQKEEILTAIRDAQAIWQDYTTTNSSEIFSSVSQGNRAHAQKIIDEVQFERYTRIAQQISNTVDTLKLQIEDMEATTAFIVHKKLLYTFLQVFVVFTIILGVTFLLVKTKIEIQGVNIELEKTVAELHQQKILMSTILESTAEAIFAKDKSGKYLSVNKTGAQMLGFDQSEIIGHTDMELLPADVAGALRKTDEEVMLLGQAIMREELENIDGKAGVFLANKVPWRDSEDNIIGVVGVMTDISDQKRREDERIQLEQQLRQAQKLESLGVLAGGVAHDFNNILTAIVGNAELALLRINKESPGVDNLHKIGEAAARAADLAKQMLAYSGKGKFVIENINLNLLLKDMLNMLEVSISKKAAMRLNLIPDLPSVEADATQIRQIVMNLVINASEAIGEKSGVITVTTGCMDCDEDYLKSIWLDENICQGSYVYLEVVDTGCGMDEGTLIKLFDPFFTTKFTGRGLGMSAVLGIVRGHKGAIKVDSEPGKGTKFKILLPASNEPAKSFNNECYENYWKGDGTVLLVDDEETVRDICKEMLQEFGFTTITANDGREAVEIFKTTADISFVILDLTMPHMDGEQCFLELRQLKPDVKVIMSSGFNEHEVNKKFMGKGLAGFIQKPYKLSALKEAIQKI
jgi:PAS domain S-box-containing protein